MTPQPLIPTGRDCDCGHPMVWHGNNQRCAVYGTHGTGTDHDEHLHIWRNYDAPLANVVDELDAMTYGTPGPRTRRDIMKRDAA